MTYTHQLTYQETPTQHISIADIEGSDYGLSFKKDGYLDIKLQPQNACIKYVKSFLNTTENAHRSYTPQDINLQKLIDDYTSTVETEQQANTDALQDQLKAASTGQNVNILPGMEEEKLNIMDLLKEGFNGGFNLDIELFSKEMDAVQQTLDKVSEGLCNGFTFGGDNTCKGLPVPFNQAFLAPGDYHLMGCIKLPLVPLNKGLPAFSIPQGRQTPRGVQLPLFSIFSVP
jgi:hypothetical protein